MGRLAALWPRAVRSTVVRNRDRGARPGQPAGRLDSSTPGLTAHADERAARGLADPQLAGRGPHRRNQLVEHSKNRAVQREDLIELGPGPRLIDDRLDDPAQRRIFDIALSRQEAGLRVEVQRDDRRRLWLFRPGTQGVPRAFQPLAAATVKRRWRHNE